MKPEVQQKLTSFLVNKEEIKNMMHLFCVKYITFYVDKFYICTQNGDQETFSVAKSLFYLHSHVLVDIRSP